MFYTIHESNSFLSTLLPKKIVGIKWDMFVAFIGSLAIAILAQFHFPLSFTPVPITAQTLGVLIIGSSFGRKRAFLSVFSYLCEGCVGLPVFARGRFGITVLAGPTGGYLVGFILAATLMGYLSEKMMDRSYKTSFALFFIGHFVIFLSGCLWLGFFVGFEDILIKGFYPFIPGLILKTMIAGTLMPLLWKLNTKT